MSVTAKTARNAVKSLVESDQRFRRSDAGGLSAASSVGLVLMVAPWEGSKLR